MLRRICSTYGPRVTLLLIVAAAVAVGALRDPSRSLLDDDVLPTGPGLNITLGAGLQGNGSAGAPLDVTHGTTAGEVVQWNGAANTVNTYCSDPTQRYCMFAEFEQFLTNCTTIYPGFVGTASGAASGCSSISEQGHPGVLSLQTGTAATGYARFASNISAFTFGGNFGQTCAKELVRINNLSTTVIEYIARVGFLRSTTNANSTDAVQAVYDRTVSGNFWAFETRRSSVSTYKACDGTGGTIAAPITATTWYTLEQCVSADGATATLSVNGTICATNTTNIPTAGNPVGLGAMAANNSGSVPANQPFDLDYIRVTLPFGLAR